MGAYAKFDHHRSILSLSYTSNFPNTTQILLPYSENTAKLWSNPRRSCRKLSISFFNLVLKMSTTKLCWIAGGIELSSLQITRLCSITFAGPHKEKELSKTLMGVLLGILNCNCHSSAKTQCQYYVSLEVSWSKSQFHPEVFHILRSSEAVVPFTTHHLILAVHHV